MSSAEREDEAEALFAPSTGGIDNSDGDGETDGVSASFCFLSASAWRFGGPRRLLGLSYVQGMSKLAQERQGGPLVSHCACQRVELGMMIDTTFTLRMLQASQAFRSLVLWSIGAKIPVAVHIQVSHDLGTTPDAGYNIIPKTMTDGRTSVESAFQQQRPSALSTE